MTVRSEQAENGTSGYGADEKAIVRATKRSW